MNRELPLARSFVEEVIVQDGLVDDLDWRVTGRGRRVHLLDNYMLEFSKCAGFWPPRRSGCWLG